MTTKTKSQTTKSQTTKSKTTKSKPKARIPYYDVEALNGWLLEMGARDVEADANHVGVSVEGMASMLLALIEIYAARGESDEEIAEKLAPTLQPPELAHEMVRVVMLDRDAAMNRLGDLYARASCAALEADRDVYINTLVEIYDLECVVKRYLGDSVPRMGCWHTLIKDHMTPEQAAIADTLICDMEGFQCRRNDEAYAEARAKATAAAAN